MSGRNSLAMVLSSSRTHTGSLASSASIQGTAKLFVVQLNLGAGFVMLGFTPGQLMSSVNIMTLP